MNGHITYRDLLEMHTEDAHVCMWLERKLRPSPEEVKKRAEEIAKQMKAQEVAQEMAEVSSLANRLEAWKLRQTQ